MLAVIVADGSNVHDVEIVDGNAHAHCRIVAAGRYGHGRVGGACVVRCADFDAAAARGVCRRSKAGLVIHADDVDAVALSHADHTGNRTAVALACRQHGTHVENAVVRSNCDVAAFNGCACADKHKGIGIEILVVEAAADTDSAARSRITLPKLVLARYIDVLYHICRADRNFFGSRYFRVSSYNDAAVMVNVRHCYRACRAESRFRSCHGSCSRREIGIA